MVEAEAHVGLLAAAGGQTDLAGIDLLDMGCGTKLTEYLLRSGAPIGSYTGIDVWRELVDELTANVDDPRFRYRYVDFHNEMYNQRGAPLTAASTLPLDGATT